MARDIHRTCVMMKDTRQVFDPTKAVARFKSMFAAVRNLDRVYKPLCLVSSQTILAPFYSFLAKRLQNMYALGGAPVLYRPQATTLETCDINRQTLRYSVTENEITINYTIPLSMRLLESPENVLIVNSVNVNVKLSPAVANMGHITYSVDFSGLRADMTTLRDSLTPMRRDVYNYLKGAATGPLNIYNHAHLLRGGGTRQRRSRKTKRLNRTGRTSRKTFVTRR